jgi:hypothetical protein
VEHSYLKLEGDYDVSATIWGTMIVNNTVPLPGFNMHRLIIAGLSAFFGKMPATARQPPLRARKTITRFEPGDTVFAGQLDHQGRKMGDRASI